MNNKFIYTPGPTRVRENVRLEIAKSTTNPDIDIEFCDFYKNTCEKIASRIVKRPERAELKGLIRNNSFLSLGKQFGVSDNTIRKWCASYDLPTKKNYIKSLTDKEWESI